MELDLILKGLVLGFSIAAPVGPIGILCIRRTLADGQLHGIISGIGAASADALYGALAGFGFTFVTAFLVAQQIWLQVFGGLFLCYLGVSTFFSKPAQEAAAARSGGLLQSYVSTLLLTLSNPMTIISFVAVFASVGLSSGAEQPLTVLSFIGGVFGGSALWWLLLSIGVGLLRNRLTPAIFVWVNRVSGLIIFVFGLAAGLSAIFYRAG